MTYAELAALLLELTPDQLQDNVAIEVGGETYSGANEQIHLQFATDENDVLDTDHPVLVVHAHSPN